MGPRALNAVLGLWLFFSTFLFREAAVPRWVGWVAGALAVTNALVGLSGTRRGRSLNAALGAWMILFAILLPRVRPIVFWNDLLIGFAIALLALVKTTPDLRQRRPADV